MDEYLHFENAIFCSSNIVIFLRFLLITCLYYCFFTFLFLINKCTFTVQLSIHTLIIIIIIIIIIIKCIF